MEDIYFEKILSYVKEKRNLDFSQYRKNLLERRVMARVRMTKRNNFEEYYLHLKSNLVAADEVYGRVNADLEGKVYGWK